MEVNIDQSRCDDVVFDVEDGRAVWFEIRTDGIDFAVAHADVERTILVARRIDQSAVFEQKIWRLSIHRFLSCKVFLKFEIQISKSEINPKLKSESSFLFETLGPFVI